jgi:hypothetical protein
MFYFLLLSCTCLYFQSVCTYLYFLYFTIEVPYFTIGKNQVLILVCVMYASITPSIKKSWAGLSSVVELLLSMHDALGLISSSKKEKKKRKEISSTLRKPCCGIVYMVQGTLLKS